MDFLNPSKNPFGFSMFISGFVLLSILVSFIWRAKWQKTILTGGVTDGTPAVGIITGIGQTGTVVNGMPRLTFTVQVLPTAGGSPVPQEVHIKQTIPPMAMSMLAPGKQVALVMSQKDPSKVKIDIQGTTALAASAGMTAAGYGSMPGAPGVTTPGATMPGFAAGAPAPGLPTTLGGAAVAGVRSNDELVNATDAVPATITAVQETGQSYGSDPLLILTLQVQGAAGQYATQGGYRVPVDRRSRLMPGTVVRAHPDPANPQAVGIDWRTL